MYLRRKIVKKQGEAGSQKNNSQLRSCMWLLDYSRCFNAFRQCVYSTEMHCNTPIEWAYYTSTKVSIQKDLSVYSAQPGAAINQDLKIYKSVLPLCEKCKVNGKPALKRGGLQIALANRARGKQKKQKK